MAVDPALQDSLNRSLTASGDLAKVRRAGKSRPGSENALNLLDSIIDDTVVEAERERRQREEKRIRAEEEARLQKEREEAEAKKATEQAIIAELQAQEELKQNQAEMQARLQREKDIEAGLIDLEEEARLKREEEERKRAEAEAKRRKEEERLRAIELKKIQEIELQNLRNEEMAKAAMPKKSKLPAILGAVAAVVLIGGGVGGYLIATQEELPANYPYDLHDNGFYHIVFLEESSGSNQIALDIVKQAEDPKPVKASSRGRKKNSAAAEPANKPKPTLTGGKGGLFGGGKRGL